MNPFNFVVAPSLEPVPSICPFRYAAESCSVEAAQTTGLETAWGWQGKNVGVECSNQFQSVHQLLVGLFS
jgi:hypothetical protein